VLKKIHKLDHEDVFGSISFVEVQIRVLMYKIFSHQFCHSFFLSFVFLSASLYQLS